MAWLMRQGTVVILTASVSIGATCLVNAAVTGQGDVSPFVDLDGEPVPALPEFGGTIEGDIIVGGTGIPEAVTTYGRMTVDLPLETDPLIADNGFIGFNADGIGEVTITGFNSQWSLNEKLSVGVNGLGYLTISGAAVVRSNLNGSDSDPDAFVGEFLGSQGFVTVTGVGTQWRNDNLIVGHRGTGTVTVQNGAWLRTAFDAVLGEDFSTSGSINSLGRGTVIVTGGGSRWMVGETLTVGDAGRGELQVIAGGEVRAGRAVVVGASAGAYGKMVVSGQGSQFWAERTLSLAATAAGASVAGAQAELYVNDNGILRADTSLTLGRGAFLNLAGGTILTPTIASTGVIRGAGTINGAITNDGDIRNAAGLANTRERLLFNGAVTNNDNIESVGGEMEFKGDVTNNTPNGDIYGKDAIFRFVGTNGLVNNSRLTLDNTLVESTVITNNAALAVMAGEEASTVLGDVVLSGTSILEMELGDDYSQLWVTGNASLGGTLELSLAPNYTPMTGDSFEILRSDALTGTFASAVMTSNSGLLWDVDYTADSVFVTFGGTAPTGSGADINGDGIVNEQDLAIMVGNFGMGVNPPPFATQADGDATGDGIIDGADFLAYQRQYGGPPPAVPATALVPEPTSLLLAAAVLGLPLAARRRR